MFHTVKSTALFLVVIVFLVSNTLAQDKTSDSGPKHDGKIEVKFDKANDETTVRLSEISILDGESESLSMVLVGSYTGKNPPVAPSEILLLLNARSKQRRYQVGPQLVVTADGQVIRTSEMKNYGSRTVDNRIVEPLLTMMPYDVVAKMAKAKKVSFIINQTEYELTAINLEAIREFARRVIP